MTYLRSAGGGAVSPLWSSQGRKEGKVIFIDKAKGHNKFIMLYLVGIFIPADGFLVSRVEGPAARNMKVELEQSFSSAICQNDQISNSQTLEFLWS